MYNIYIDVIIMPSAWIYYKGGTSPRMLMRYDAPTAQVTATLTQEGYTLVQTVEFRDCAQCGERKGVVKFPDLSCNHSDVCAKCILTNYTNRLRKCPVCRANITASKINEIRSSEI